MKKLILSWIAKMNDFRDGEVNVADSPNVNLHKYFYDHDEHILLSQAEGDDLASEMLAAKIRALYPTHKVSIAYLDLYDVIDIHEIKPKVERLIMRLRDTATFDIFWSPGTSMMQLSWYIVHSQGIAQTRIIQGRPLRFVKPGEEPFFETEFAPSPTPVSIMVKADPQPKITAQKASAYRITDAIAPIYARARKIAAVDNVTTLIRGQSGTGKEHLARYIHEESGRKQHPYVTVNCSSIGDSLLESRLFGYVKGAFTGADKDQPGFFEAAHGGTLFLDEIGDISGNMQQALLRVLQEGEVMRVGANESRKVDVRIVTATNRDLEAMCQAGEFRWDLYYRLVVTELELPALRDRGQKELASMVDFFLERKAEKFARNRLNILPEAQKLLFSYAFPGNLRELENLVENLYVFNETEVTITDLPERIRRRSTSHSFLLRDAEALHIEKVLQFHQGNLSQTAQALGIVLNTLKKKMREYGLGKFAPN